MKYLSIVIFLFVLSIPSFADCASLSKKYKAPDPASKTMSQVKRWVKRKVKNSGDAKTLQKCLVAQAADNPNKVQVAGK